MVSEAMDTALNGGDRDNWSEGGGSILSSQMSPSLKRSKKKDRSSLMSRFMDVRANVSSPFLLHAQTIHMRNKLILSSIDSNLTLPTTLISTSSPFLLSRT
jgi:hypothetical protein